MAYFTEAFSEQSIATLSRVINAFLAANPTFVGISLTLTVEGAGFFALLLYSA